MRSGGHGRIVRHVFLSFGDALIIRDELLVTFRALLGHAHFLRTIRIIGLMEIQRGGVLVEILEVRFRSLQRQRMSITSLRSMSLL